MVPIDPESSLADRTVPAPDAPPSASTGPEPTASRPGRLLAIACVAGLLAGAASTMAGEAILRRYQGDLVQPITTRPKPEDVQRFRDARVYSAVWTFTTMAGVLGLAMGLAGGLARRSAAAAAGAGTAGLLLGAAVTAGLSLVLVSNFFKRHDPQSGDLMLPLLTHCGIWSGVGAIAGLAFGLGLGGKGRWPYTVGGGLVGAAAATIIYELAGAVIRIQQDGPPAVRLGRDARDGRVVDDDLRGRGRRPRPWVNPRSPAHPRPSPPEVRGARPLGSARRSAIRAGGRPARTV